MAFTLNPFTGQLDYYEKADTSNLEVTQNHQILAGISAVAGQQVTVRLPMAGTITSAIIAWDVSGSAVVDIWLDTYANYPPTVADTITASAKPTLTSEIKATDSTLTGWTKTFNAGDWMIFNVDSASTLDKVFVVLTYERT